ncbi:hypothetical protein THUN1379_27040 [Paludibacterium sp. THUN1379]|uniref:hypothetical protein n=1 Tax=Paludibacterium sp. THUN1379 TaxID=3112107 RepID=UPI0030858322|nr:hypothetical protein THUN1379_27040 [Paludibacterium sp. THUN1379]
MNVTSSTLPGAVDNVDIRQGDVPSIALLMRVVMQSMMEIHSILKLIDQNNQVTATAMARLSYNTRSEAAQNNYQAEITKASAKIATGVTSVFTALLPEKSPLGKMVNSFNQIATGSAELKAAEFELDGQQNMADAEFQRGLSEQSEKNAEGSANDARQVLSNLQQFSQALVQADANIQQSNSMKTD